MPSVGTAYVNIRVNTAGFESSLDKMLARLSTKMEKAGEKLGKDFEKGLKNTKWGDMMSGLPDAVEKASKDAAKHIDRVGDAAVRNATKIDAASAHAADSVRTVGDAAKDSRNEVDELGKAGTRAKNAIGGINLNPSGGGGGRGGGFRRAAADANSFSSALKSIRPNMQRAIATFTHLHNMAAFVGTAMAGLVGGLISVAQGLFAIVANAASVAPALGSAASGMLALVQVAAVLKLALKGVTEAFKLGTKSMDAQDKAAGAAFDNSKAIAAAMRALRDAQDALGDAYRNAARAAEDAARKTLRAEQQLAASQEKLKQAQLALNEARKTALEQLEDIGFAAEDASLHEQRAAIALQEAQANLLAVSELAPDNRARIEAELAFKEADLNMRQAVDAREDADKAQQDAAKNGIEGTEAMRSARQDEADAAAEVSDNTQALADARRDEADQAVDSADRIAEAQQNVADAQERLNEALNDHGPAAKAAIDAQDAFRKAMAKLGPEQRKFVNKLLGMREGMRSFKNAIAEPLFDRLNDALDTFNNGGLLKVFQTGLEGTSAALGDVAKEAATVTSQPAFKGALASAMKQNNEAIGNFGSAGVSLANAFVQIADAAGPVLIEFSEWVEKLADSASASTTLGNKTGDLDKKIRKGAEKVKEFAALFKQLWRWLKNAGGAASEAADQFAWTDSKGNEKTGFIPMLTDNLKTLNDTFDKDSAIKDFTQTLKNMVEIGKAVKTVTQPFIDMGKDPKIAESFKKISESKAFETIGASATSALPQLTDIALSILDVIAAMSKSKSIDTMLTVLKNVSGVVADIVTAFSNIKLPDALSGRSLISILGMVTGFLSALKVIFWAIARLGGPTLKIGMLFKPVLAVVKLIGKSIGFIFKGIGQALGALGRMIPILGRVFGVFKNIFGMVGRLLSSIRNFARILTTMAKQKLRIGGPSGGAGDAPDLKGDALLTEEFTKLKLALAEDGTKTRVILERIEVAIKGSGGGGGGKGGKGGGAAGGGGGGGGGRGGGGGSTGGAQQSSPRGAAGAPTAPMPKAPPGVKEAGAKIGRDMTAGIVLGLEEGMISVETAAINVGRAAAAGVAKGAQTASPSKLTLKTGTDVMAGLTLGIEEGEAAAIAAGRGAGAAAAGAVATGAKSQAGTVGAAGAAAGGAGAAGGVLPAGAAGKAGKFTGLMGKMGKAMGPVAKLAGPLAGGMKLVGGAFSLMLGPVGMIAMTLIPILWPLIEKLNEKFHIMDKVMAGVSWVIDKVSTAFTWLLENVIQPLFNWLKDHWKLILGILTGPIGLAVLAITSNWDKIKEVVDKAVKFVTDLLGKIWDGILTGWQVVADFFSGLWNDKIKPVFDAVVDEATKILTGIWDGITAGWDIVWGWLTGLWDSIILPWITEFVGFYYGIFLKVWDGIKAGWDIIWTWLSGLWANTIKPWVDDLVAREIRGLKRIWDGITEGWKAISTWLSNLWKDKIKPKIDSLLLKAKNLLKTIWSGITSGWTAVGTWISNLWTDKIKPKIDTLKKNMSDSLKGVWNGMGSGLITALNWIADKVNWMIGKINSVLDKFGSKGITWTWPKLEWNGFAQGGPVRGPGGPTADKIPARLSNGEFVMPTRAAKKLGPEALEYMRRTGKLPPHGGFGWDTLTAPFRAIGDVISKGAKIALQWVLSQVDSRLGDSKNDNFVTKILRAGLHWGADKIVGWGSGKDSAASGVNETGPAVSGVMQRGNNPTWGWPAAIKAMVTKGPAGHGRAWAVDFGVPSGTPLLAISSGVVKHAGMGTSFNSTYGNYVQLVGHPTQQKSLYAHMSKVSVKAGQRVVRGQILGLSGNTGHSTGPHLHFELNPAMHGNVIEDMKHKGIYIGTFGKGGVVSGQGGGIMAMIGEAGKSERVTPLDQDGFTPAERKIIATLNEKLGSGGGGDTFQIHPSEKINEVALADLVARRVSWKRRRGAGR